MTGGLLGSHNSGEVVQFIAKFLDGSAVALFISQEDELLFLVRQLSADLVETPGVHKLAFEDGSQAGKCRAE